MFDGSYYSKKTHPVLGWLTDMNVSRKNLPKSIVELVIEIPAGEAEVFFQKAARRLASGVEIAGFRKGKAPLHVVEKHLSSKDLFAEAAELAVQRTYLEALQKEGLEPLDKPDIEVLKISRGDMFSYRVRVATLPRVELPVYKKFRVHQERAEVSEKEIQDAIAYLQKSRATYKKAERGAAKGDLVEIDFTLRQNTVILEGGQATNHPLILGEEKFIPGFEKALEGMRAGEEKEFPLTFPTDYAQKELAGRHADCNVKMRVVHERRLPDLTDEFARSVGKFEDLPSLKKSVSEGLRAEKEGRAKMKAEIALATQIAEKSKMDVPDVLIGREDEKMFSELESRLTGGGITLDQYLAHLKKSKEDLRRDWRAEAEKRVKVALVLRAIAKAEDIKPAPEEVEERIRDTLKKYASPEDSRKDLDPHALREYAETVLTNERVFAFLYKTCIIHE